MAMSWLKTILRSWYLRRRYPSAVIHHGASVAAGSSLGEYVVLFGDSAVVDSSIGRYSYVQARSKIYNAEVGPFASIASDVTIGLGDHPMFMASTSPVFYDPRQPLPRFFTAQCAYEDVLPRTIVGPDVWIGQGALLLAGVNVGAGAVIGAGAVVTRDIPPYAVAVGVPSRVKSWRFPPETRERLLQSRWWELGDGRLEALTHLFADPEKLLNAIEESENSQEGAVSHL